MIRWSYVVTRILIVALMLGLLWAAMNPVLRLTLIHSGQAATGAKVDIASVQTLLTRSRLGVNGISVADPDSPMSNLVEIGNASFDLETGSVLRRRLVVSEGRLSGIQFHTNRSASGQLEAKEPEQPKGPGLFDKYGDLGNDWLEDSVDRLEQQVEEEFVSVRLAKELEQRWPQEYDRIESQTEDLSRRGKQLVRQVEAMSDKPLDHLDKIQPTLQEADRLRRDGLALKTKLATLKQQVALDREAIRNAKDRDLQKVRQKLDFKKLDGAELSEYLLGPDVYQKVSTALEWIQWSRSAVSTNQPKVVEPASRGRNVIFPSMVRSPDLLIRKLLVDGSGTADGQEFAFSGIIGDITHQPRRHNKPTTVKIESNGAVQLTANATLDRRGDQPTERFVVDIPSLTQSARTLGDAEKLAVSISPGKAKIHVDLKLRGDAIAGTIDFRQDNVAVTPQLKQAYSKEILAADADKAFDAISTIHAVVQVGGQVKKPALRLQSNLGPQLADGMNAILHNEIAAREKQLTEKADAEIDRQMARFEQKLVQRHGDVLKKLELGDSELAMLKNEIASRVGAPSEVLDKGKELLKLFRR